MRREAHGGGRRKRVKGQKKVVEELKQRMTGRHKERERESVERREQANSGKRIQLERKVEC